MRVRVCWSKVDEHGIIVMIESSLRLVQATFIALTLPASFPFVKACQHRLLDRNYFRPSLIGIETIVILLLVVFIVGLIVGVVLAHGLRNEMKRGCKSAS